MKKRTAAAFLFGIFCLVSVSVYGSEADAQGTELFSSEFTSEAAVFETAEDSVVSAEPGWIEDYEGDSAAESADEETSDESAETGDFSAESPAEALPEENLQDVDNPDGTAADDELTDAGLDISGEADAENDAEEELLEEPVFSSGEAGSLALEGTSADENWTWDASSGIFSCTDAQGNPVSVPELVSKYTAAGSYYGYFQIGGCYYCLDDTGKPRTGTISLTSGGVSAKYYFQQEANSDGIPGEMYIGWRRVNGTYGERWLYYDTGSTTPADRGKLWVHKNIVTKLDTSVMGDDVYLLNSGGYVVKKGMRKAENGSYYLSDANGVIYRNKLVTYKGYQYYVGSSGKRASWKNSWHRLENAGNRLYYFGSTPGRVEKKTGWQAVTVNGKFKGWYYFNKNGIHYMDRLLKNGLYFTSTGRLASGLTVMDGKMYFFAVSTSTSRNGKMAKSQLIVYKGKRYYAGSDGRLKKYGWQKVGDDYYYFKNYSAVTETFMTKNGVYGYLDSTGKFTTGWLIVDDANNKVKYIDPQKKGFVTNTSRVIDGLTYYFDEDGYRINDVTDRVSGPYSLVVDRVNGVITIYNSDRTIPVKSVRCSVGLASTPTVTGTYTLTRAGRWQLMMGNSWGQYASQITGNYLIHSVPMGTKDPHQVPAQYYYALGEPASHGCVRTNVADAKWIYENCNGSTITILDGTYQENESFKGPLGRNAIVPMTVANTDPTDPSV